MEEIRTMKGIYVSRSTREGAGVRLKRVFGFHEVPQFDPFLLLDDFHSENPNDYIAGFPWHPHRGIETITYMLHGELEHGDNLGNGGIIHSGECQWMTAGSGIIHQEMPHQQEGLLWGFQLWANLPSSHKMMAPRYRDITSDQIPEITLKGGAIVKVISGEVHGQRGPVQDIITDPQYLDVTVPPGSEFQHHVQHGHTLFAYVIDGAGFFDLNKDQLILPEHLVLYSDGNQAYITTTDTPLRFLLISGQPIGEPVAWYGPIVMNTQEELQTAFREYTNGTFIKARK